MTRRFSPSAALLRAGKLDHSVMVRLRTWRHPRLTLFFRTVTHLGSPAFFAVMVVSFWFLSTPLSMHLLRRLPASGVAYLTSEVIKRLFTRRRPQLAMTEFESLIHTPRDHSFPSGHAAVTVAAAVAFAGADLRVTLGSALIASLVCFSRIYLGVHFLLDVAAGAVLGAACGIVAPLLSFS